MGELNSCDSMCGLQNVKYLLSSPLQEVLWFRVLTACINPNPLWDKLFRNTEDARGHLIQNLYFTNEAMTQKVKRGSQDYIEEK